MNWTKRQIMAIALARQIEDEKSYIIGTGLPLIGATLAKNTHAPNAHFIFESGIFESSPLEVPKSVTDLRLNMQASVLWPQYRYFGFQALSAERNNIDAGFIGGAQIDPYGNINSTCIGEYGHQTSQFSGSGGANGIATFCDTVILMKHQRRRFVEHVDYITSPGWIDGPSGRLERGLIPDKGPRAVITDLGIMRFDDNKRMYLAEYFPGVTRQEIMDNTGFELNTLNAVLSPEPDEYLLDVLVNKVDR